MSRDATSLGAPTSLRFEGKSLRFTAPGDDLLCGRAAAYEISTDGRAFVGVTAEPVTGGETASVTLQSRPKTVSVRAVDDQGNVGRAGTLRR
jgi:hypothetical protein